MADERQMSKAQQELWHKVLTQGSITLLHRLFRYLPRLSLSGDPLKGGLIFRLFRQTANYDVVALQTNTRLAMWSVGVLRSANRSEAIDGFHETDKGAKQKRVISAMESTDFARSVRQT